MQMIARSGRLDSSGCDIEITSPSMPIQSAFTVEVRGGTSVAGYKTTSSFEEKMEASFCKYIKGLPVVHSALKDQREIDERISWIYEGDIDVVQLINPIGFEVEGRIFVQSWTGKKIIKKIKKESGRILSKNRRDVFFEKTHPKKIIFIDKWDDLRHSIKINTEELEKELLGKINEGILSFLERMQGEIYLHERGKCPRFSLERKSTPLKTIGLSAILYKDKPEIVEPGKKIWLDFKRGPSHVLFQTFDTICGTPFNLHIFPLR